MVGIDHPSLDERRPANDRVIQSLNDAIFLDYFSTVFALHGSNRFFQLDALVYL
jgi:hypothetical protein